MANLNRSNRIIASKTLTKMLVSYLGVILISILLISVILYNNFSKATIEDIQINIQENLSQSMNQMEIIRNQVYALGLQLLGDSEIVYAMYQDDSEEYTKFKATNKLIQARDSNPMIHSIYVYNSKEKFYLSSFGSSEKYSLMPEMAELLSRYKNSIQYNFIPLIHSYKSNIGEDINEPIITSVFSESLEVNLEQAEDGSSFKDSIIIINLKAEYLQKSFTALNSETDILLLNKNGDMVCGTDLNGFGNNLANIDYINEVLNSKKQAGYFKNNIDKEKSLITYNSSENLPFILVDQSNYSTLLKKVYNLRTNIIIVVIFIFLFCAIISVLAAYNIYLPFDKLVKNVRKQMDHQSDNTGNTRTYNEMEYLTSSFSSIIKKSNELETSARKMLLRGLLEADSSALESASRKMGELKLNIAEGQLCVLIFSIDGYSRPVNLKSNMVQNYFKTEIESLILEVLSDRLNIETVDLEGDLTAVIVNVNTEIRFYATLMEKMRLVQDKISDKLGITVTGTIGLTVDRVENLHLSYGDCLELLKYRFVYGYRTIIDNDLIQASVNKTYPSIEKNTKKIIQAIKSCDTAQMESEINEVIVLITNRQYDFIRLTINQLALDIMKAVEPLINTEDYTMDFNNIFTNINNIDTLEGIGEWFILFCNGIISKLEKKKDNKKKDMIDMVLSYMESNYHRPELSAEMLSELINITPGYFGKLFNEYTSKTVNEYIVELRMNKAKELLQESTSSINDITLKVGFSNQSYFTATFKKLYGLTPNQYRIESLKKQQ